MVRMSGWHETPVDATQERVEEDAGGAAGRLGLMLRVQFPFATALFLAAK